LKQGEEGWDDHSSQSASANSRQATKRRTWLIAPTATPPENVSALFSSSLHAAKQSCFEMKSAINILIDTNDTKWHASSSILPKGKGREEETHNIAFRRDFAL
jgi:hypothetical protein